MNTNGVFYEYDRRLAVLGDPIEFVASLGVGDGYRPADQAGGGGGGASAVTHAFKVTYSGNKLMVGSGTFNGSTVASSELTASSSGTVTLSSAGVVELNGADLIVASFTVTGTGASAKVTSVTQQLFSDVAYQLYGGADGGNDFTQIIRGASFVDATAGRGYAASMRGFEVTDADDNGALVSAKKIQLITAAGKSATLDVADLTKDMTLQEMTVLVAGSKTGDTVTLTKKKVLALISTPEADTDDSFDVAGGSDYTAGDGISIAGSTISASIGAGLLFQPSGQIAINGDAIMTESDHASAGSAIQVGTIAVGPDEIHFLLNLRDGAAANDVWRWDGTSWVLSPGVPDGTAFGVLLQWDGTRWVELDLGADAGPVFWDGAGTLASLPASPAGVYYSDGTDWGTIPFGPEEWTVYDGGVVTTRKFLTDNPDPVV